MFPWNLSSIALQKPSGLKPSVHETSAKKQLLP